MVSRVATMLQRRRPSVVVVVKSRFVMATGGVAAAAARSGYDTTSQHVRQYGNNLVIACLSESSALATSKAIQNLMSHAFQDTLSN